jgi:hypothetical protein
LGQNLPPKGGTPNLGHYRRVDFRLNQTGQFRGNFLQAEMVKGFLGSIEQRRRFWAAKGRPALLWPFGMSPTQKLLIRAPE